MLTLVFVHLLRACETCGIDLCVYCCEDVRRLFGKVMCPMCSSLIELKKQLSEDMLRDLREIVKASMVAKKAAMIKSLCTSLCEAVLLKLIY